MSFKLFATIFTIFISIYAVIAADETPSPSTVITVPTAAPSTGSPVDPASLTTPTLNATVGELEQL